MIVEEHDLEIESFVRTARGGVLILAKDIHDGSVLRISFSRDDYGWLVGEEEGE